MTSTVRYEQAIIWKDGLANNQDFYYINTLITIIADSREELEWRTNEMKKADAVAGSYSETMLFQTGFGISVRIAVESAA